jgi:hypothetical protein
MALQAILAWLNALDIKFFARLNAVFAPHFSRQHDLSFRGNRRSHGSKISSYHRLVNEHLEEYA